LTYATFDPKFLAVREQATVEFTSLMTTIQSGWSSIKNLLECYHDFRQGNFLNRKVSEIWGDLTITYYQQSECPVKTGVSSMSVV